MLLHGNNEVSIENITVSIDDIFTIDFYDFTKSWDYFSELSSCHMIIIPEIF